MRRQHKKGGPGREGSSTMEIVDVRTQEWGHEHAIRRMGRGKAVL